MKRLWTIIGVTDVARAFGWYQSLLGLPLTAPAHVHFGQVLDRDGTVLLCLHQWGAHEHPTLASPDRAGTGNGLLLFFRVDDFDQALERAAVRLGAKDAANVTGSIWEAGAEASGLVLGVSFQTSDRILLNSLHVVSVSAGSSAEIAPGIVVRSSVERTRRDDGR